MKKIRVDYCDLPIQDGAGFYQGLIFEINLSEEDHKDWVIDKIFLDSFIKDKPPVELHDIDGWCLFKEIRRSILKEENIDGLQEYVTDAWVEEFGPITEEEYEGSENDEHRLTASDLGITTGFNRKNSAWS